MNDEIRKNISCPQFGDNHYGKWGALNLEQRKKIKDLLNKIDNLEMIENKYIQLQSNWNSLREWLEKQKHDAEICKEWNRKNNFNDIDYDRDIKRFDFVLNKMNELEGNESNGK